MPPLYNNQNLHIPYATNGYLSHSTKIPTQYNSLPNAPQLEYYTPANIYTQIPQLNDATIPGYNSMVPLTTANYYDVSINSTFSPSKTPKIRRRAFSKRSKTGCFTCRERRIKCDECKPICKNCTKSKRICKFPDPEEVKQKTTKFKSNTNLKEIKSKFDKANIDQIAIQENSSTIQNGQSTDAHSSNHEDFLISTTKTQEPIIWKENTFKTIATVDGLKVKSFQNSSTEPTSMSHSTGSLYQNNQQPKQRSERSQSLHIQRQQQQQQQHQHQQHDHHTYANANQFHPLYAHSYNLPPTQLPHDFPLPPQFQSSTLHPLGYQAYKDSISNTNYGMVNVVPTQGNHISMKSTADYWGSNRYTHSNTETFTTGDDKEYFYVPYGKRSQSDNLNHSQKLPNYQQLQINQPQQFQPNTTNSNSSVLHSKQLNEFNLLPNKEQ
ncbi:hypothetical protein CANINC_002163 [Pichia inconspicua]|uniref:Zn(2)-C6 fungal-type domain-containing protein n=1 Tax=Pichia inconspicua TaxID=52247 RepID=A0A4T0X352_9ASCO|nr:hypothetical protein CANINC_002163 [[Candida] inconspicua]